MHATLASNVDLLRQAMDGLSTRQGLGDLILTWFEAVEVVGTYGIPAKSLPKRLKTYLTEAEIPRK